MEKTNKWLEDTTTVLSNYANSTALLHLLLERGIVTLEEFVEAKIQALMEFSQRHPDILSESDVSKLADSYKPLVEKEKREPQAQVRHIEIQEMRKEA